MNTYPEHIYHNLERNDLDYILKHSKHIDEKRLYTCQAYIGTGDYCDSLVYLRSYDTIVAIYDKDEDALYDILRTEYGYTATSSQHISKFEKYIKPSRYYRTYYKDGQAMYRRLY